ncbi:MAG: tetratricopeptide repeat protein, partial [Gammaproteobacteria bacterium]|nr:tetratricopeptide repeat protein [Gammaproteobacteria bacterium]
MIQNQHVGGFCAVAVLLPLLAIQQAYTQEFADTDISVAYEEAIAGGLYGEAEVAAKRLVENAIRAGRRDESSTARLLSKLALAQRLNKNFGAALQNYELAVSIIESGHDMLDLELIEPLLGIGNTHIDNERPDLALEHLDRALHVRHVNNGPHSLEQSETLEMLATAYKKMGEPRKAVDLADRVYWLYSREFPGKSMEVVPALLKKGHILGEVGDRREQRDAYIAAIDIVEHNEGESSLNLIGPVISLGRSHVEEYYDLQLLALSEEELPDTRLLDKAKSYYESALDLARTTADVPWQLHTDALLALGDFYTINDEQSRARELYRDAWQLLSADEA